MILLIIPIVDFIVFGYFVKVLRDSASSKSPPKIEGYMEMFINGLLAFITLLIYSIPAIILSAGLIFFPSIAYIVFIVIVALILFVFGFMAIVHMFKKKSFGKAFAFNEIFDAIMKIGLLRYIAFLVIYLIAGVIVVLVVIVLRMIPFVGVVIGVIVALAATVLIMTSMHRTIGLLYDSAMGIGGPVAPVMAPAPSTPAPGTPPPAPPLT
jgi:hypothetical protein